MRNKVSIEKLLEKLELDIKKQGYYIHSRELEEAYGMIEKLLETTSNIQTLINRETND